MLKRNIAILIAGGLLGAQANLAGAGDSPSQMLPAQARYLEERAASIPSGRGGLEMASRATAAEGVVTINAATKYINAEHGEVLVINNDKGQSFTWKADTLGEAAIPLKAIAPTGFAAGETRVYVRHPMAHISGG